jgi:hypothetical protein
VIPIDYSSYRLQPTETLVKLETKTGINVQRFEFILLVVFSDFEKP